MRANRDVELPSSTDGSPLEKLQETIQSLFQRNQETDQHVQPVVDPSVRAKRVLLSFLACAVLLFAGGFAAYKGLPRKATQQETFLSQPHKYRSADGSCLFWLVNSSDCEFAAGKDRINMTYRFYLNDWRDAVELAFGTLSQKQYWLYQTIDGVIDDNNNALYASDASESKLADRLELIGQYADMCWLKKNRYPDLPTRTKASFNLEYDNPFTKEKEVPSFQTLTIGDGNSEEDDDKARAKLYSDLSFGGTWKDAPEAHPGQIRCCAVHFLNPRGDTQGFIVQIIGADGKPLRGNRSGTSFFYALENGKQFKTSAISDKPQLPFKGQSGIKPIVVWYFLNKPDANLVFLLKNGPIFLFGALTFLFGAICFSTRGEVRVLMIVLLALSAIMALVFVVGKAIS